MAIRKSNIVEFYSIIYNADKSFRKLNGVLRKFNYEIIQIKISEFEKKFRPVFNLEFYNEKKHTQNVLISYINKFDIAENCLISDEFYQTVTAFYTNKNDFFSSGFVTLIRSKKVFKIDQKSGLIDQGMIDQDLNKLKKFTFKLQSCLRFARYDSIDCHFYFARVIEREHLISLLDIKNCHLPNKVQSFVGRDTAMISALLNIDQKINGYTLFVINFFQESFNIRNIQIRFVHLINCLELCFNFMNTDLTVHSVAGYSSLLVAVNKEEYVTFYSRLISCFSLKKEITSGEYIKDLGLMEFEILYDKTNFVEDLSRKVIKKLLYQNIKTKEDLHLKLKHKRRVCHSIN